MTKTIVLLPNDNVKLQKLNRFHADAAKKPLLQMVQWTRRQHMSTSNGTTSSIQLAVDGDFQTLYEFHQIACNKTRSWFIGNDVHKNGNVVMLTPMDPTFVLISTIWSQRNRFHSLYDLFSGCNNLWWLRLQTANTQTVAKVCQIQEEDNSVDNLYVKADETKILEFLDAKVHRIVQELHNQSLQHGAQAASKSVDSSFVLPSSASSSPSTTSSSISESQDDADLCKKEAIEILSEYLPEEIVEALSTRHGVGYCSATSSDDASQPPKVVERCNEPVSSMEDQIRRFDVRQQTATGTPNNKRTSDKATHGNSSVNRKKSNKLAKVDTTGMRSISSFFGKKS